MTNKKSEKKSDQRKNRSIVPKNMQEVRERIYKHLPGGMEGMMRKYFQAVESFRESDPVEYAKAIERIMPYFVPKMKSIEVKNEGPTQAIQLNFTRADGTTVSIGSADTAALTEGTNTNNANDNTELPRSDKGSTTTDIDSQEVYVNDTLTSEIVEDDDDEDE